MTAGTQAARRLDRERPYRADQERSIEAQMTKGIQPKGLEPLVAWFREVIHDEVPVALHRAGVFFGRPGDGVKPEWEGGSLIGAPAVTDNFRRFIEGSPHELDADGRYARPFRATLARMAHGKPLVSRMLFQLALLDGDWRRLADKMSYPYEIMELTIERALFYCWREYATERRLT